MPTKIIIGASIIISIIHGLAGDAVPGGILPLLLVLLGLVYGVMAVDAEDPVAFLVLAIAFGAASSADVLDHIHFIGTYLDNILDPLAMVLYGGVVSILLMRAWNRLTAADAE